MQFASRSQQQSFANNVTGIMHNEPRHKRDVTKTGGLSNATGAERSAGGNSGTVTLFPRLMPVPSLAFIEVTGMNITMQTILK